MKKFFRNIRKKSPARSGPPPEGSPTLDKRSTASLVIGYDVREKELGKLHKAAWAGDVAKVQQLAKKNSSPLDKEKRTPLHLACAQGHDNVVQELLEWKAKTNIGDADSRTPLMKAVECRHERCVELLLEDKVELDSVDRDGNTSLHMAAMDGSSKIVKMLCQDGASMTIRNREGLVPLHLAVREKQEEVCRTIISFRGQVDIEDNNLRTPLMYACQDGSVNLVKLFLDHGASTVHKDAKGWLVIIIIIIIIVIIIVIIITTTITRRVSVTRLVIIIIIIIIIIILTLTTTITVCFCHQAGWSADDCTVIQGHHACSQLISDHQLRHQRGSAASTPRSTAGSRSATPRGPSPYSLPPPSTPRDPHSASLGLPAADAGGEESGEETLSKASAKGAGSDSWGDDTDISLADDKKGKGKTGKMNLAKLVGHFPSESDDGDAGRTGGGDAKDSHNWSGGAGFAAKRSSSKSYQSDVSQDDNSWAATNSPTSPRRRVSFKGDKELSEVHDIPAVGAKGYVPSSAPAGVGLQLSPEKQRAGANKGAFMEDLGLGDVDDISEFSDPPSEARPAVKSAASSVKSAASSGKDVAENSDSDWDSTVKSDHPKPGILKKWGKGDDGSDWDTTEAEDIPPPILTAPPPYAIKTVEEESDVEEDVMVVPPPPAPTIPKEGNDSLDVTPQQELELDKPSQESEWDSTAEAVTPRNIVATAVHLPPQQQDSDWDTTIEAETPRAASTPGTALTLGGADTVQPMGKDHDENSDDDYDVEKAVAVKPQATTPNVALTSQIRDTVEAMTAVTAVTATGVRSNPTARDPDHDLQEEEESGWDSDPSDTAPALPLDTEVKPQRSGGQQKMTPQVGSDTDDDDGEKTETVSDWEIEQKSAKEAKLLAEQEEKKRKEEERLRQEEKQQQEEEERKRRREEEEEEERKEEMRRREEEERKREEVRQEELRHQKWEREEAERVQKLRAEAEEALKEESLQQGVDSNEEEEDFLAHEDIQGSPPPVYTREAQAVEELVTAQNSCQVLETHGGITTTTSTSTTTTRTEVIAGGEELKRVEQRIQEETSTGKSGGALSGGGGGSYDSLQPQLSQGVPQQSSSASYLTGPTALQIKQRLQIGTSPLAYHSDGMESDDSLASDLDNRNEVQSSYPALLGSTQSFRPDFNMADDDALSYTSTEFEGNDPVPAASGPFVRDVLLNMNLSEFEGNDPVPASSGPFVRDVLLNMNLSDPSTLVQVQDYIRETKRHMEQERNRHTVLENKLQLLAREKHDLVRKLESVTDTKQSLEQNRLDLEARIRSLEYNLSEEQEKKRNAELLLTKTKEQLGRKETQFTSELEGKQRAELIKRNIELEMKAAQNTIKDLEEEKDELERQLQGQIEQARRLQEQVSEEQTRAAFHRHQETLATSASVRMQDRYLEGEEDEGEDRSERDHLSTELYAVKMELERQRSRFKDELAYMTKENEELQNCIEELKNDIKLNEEAMAHASMNYNVHIIIIVIIIIINIIIIIIHKLNEEAMAHASMNYNVHVSAFRTEVTNSTAALDKEHGLRDKLETELDSAQKRLQVAVTEKDRAVHARNDLERQCQLEKQGHTRDMEHKEEELGILKDNNQNLKHRLQSLETKLNTMDSELHVSSTSLLERSNQLQLLRQEAERYRSAQNNYDSNFRAEKEQNIKLQVQIESLQERLSQSQMEVSSLKQQVDNLHQATLNASSSDPHEHLSTVINTLRSDSDRTKAMLEERNSSLMEQVQHLKEELRSAHSRHSSVDSELRRVHSQHAELTHKLSFAEAQLQLLQKTKEQLEQERSQLKGEVERAGERQRLAQEKQLEAQARLTDLTDRLDRAERTSQLSTQHLANTSASFSAVARSKEEMEESVQRLQMDNARLETDLRHERDRTQMLQSELTDSKKVRNSLEALCSNLKSTSAHLEEKLGEETASRVVNAQEARDSKHLLKQEMATRSALGLKVKTEGSDVKEQKQVIEAQLMEESQRNQQLQKEVSNLRSHLKVAKKRLKETGGGGGGGGRNNDTSMEQEGPQYAEFRQRVAADGGKVSTPRGDPSNHHHYHHMLQSQMENGTIDVDALKLDLEMKYRRDLNSKLEEVNSYLETQALARDRLETSRTENETRLSTDKRHLEEENSNLKLQYQQALAQRESSEMEARRFKQLYESEMQWRVRLGDQLQMSADKALKPLLLSDHTARLYSSMGPLTKSALVVDPPLNLSTNHGLSNKIQAELDRSIARHLEAAPHSNIVPVIRNTEDTLLSQTLSRTNKDYIEVLKRKYCVP
ncbi:hypothetical protein ACOMHN_043389 [Nucella lapillus]